MNEQGKPRRAIRIYHNPFCGDCKRQSKITAALDWLRRIEFTGDTPPTGIVPLGQIMVQDLRTRELYLGIHALRKVCLQIPLFLPLAAALSIPSAARWIERRLTEPEPSSALDLTSPHDL